MSHDNGQLLNEILVEVLQGLGVQGQLMDDWVELPAAKRAQAVLFEHEAELEGVSIVQVDVTLELWTGRWVVESTAGYGNTRTEAISNAFNTLIESSLPPMLVAFMHTEHDAVRDAWEIDGVVRAITIGHVSARGTLPGGADMDMAWFHAFERELRTASLAEGTHWVRLYYAQQDSETVAMEVLLDNEPWEALQNALASDSFPKGKEFFSLRLFAVIQGGVDVSRAAARMIEMPGRPDPELAPVLAADGAKTRDVQALLAYVPLAFGRVALQEFAVKFSDTAVARESERDPGKEIKLVDEPVFAGAKDLADRALARGTMTQDQFLAIALRSAELHAISSAMQGGAQAKDLVVSAPVVTLF